MTNLTPTKMISATELSFSTFEHTITSTYVRWDNTASHRTYEYSNKIFKVLLQKDATYMIASNSYFDPFIIVLYNNDGTAIATSGQDTTYGTDFLSDFIAPSTGYYYIQPGWNQGSYYTTAQISVFEDIDTIDIHTANTQTTGQISVGGSVGGNIETTGDNDWFAITLTQGESYQFMLNKDRSNDDVFSYGLYNPYLRLYDANGSLIMGNNDLVAYTATTSGTYYLGASSATGGKGFYLLSSILTNTTPIITSGSTGTVAENQPITTVIYDANATDVDAGTTLTYGLSGADMSLLNINSSDGIVTLKTSANYEVKNSYNFNVIASDGKSNATKAVVVEVTDIYEIPTTAYSHLLTYDVTIQQAQAFIVTNLASPSTIYNTCSEFRVSNQMIVEIFDNAYSIDTVKGYFSANGLNPNSLDIFV